MLSSQQQSCDLKFTSNSLRIRSCRMYMYEPGLTKKCWFPSCFFWGGGKLKAFFLFQSFKGKLCLGLSIVYLGLFIHTFIRFIKGKTALSLYFSQIVTFQVFSICHTPSLDFDECLSTTTNDCSVNASCINIEGAFTCECHSGLVDLAPTKPGRFCAGKIFYILTLSSREIISRI